MYCKECRIDVVNHYGKCGVDFCLNDEEKYRTDFRCDECRDTLCDRCCSNFHCSNNECDLNYCDKCEAMHILQEISQRNFMNNYLITNGLFVPTPVHTDPIATQVNLITQHELENTMAAYLGEVG